MTNQGVIFVRVEEYEQTDYKKIAKYRKMNQSVFMTRVKRFYEIAHDPVSASGIYLNM